MSGASETYALFMFPRDLELPSFIQTLQQLMIFINNGKYVTFPLLTSSIKAFIIFFSTVTFSRSIKKRLMENQSTAYHYSPPYGKHRNMRCCGNLLITPSRRTLRPCTPFRHTRPHWPHTAHSRVVTLDSMPPLSVTNSLS